MGVGPTESPPYILKEMSRQVHDLRDPDLLEVHAENLSLLKKLFHSSGQTLTLASSSFSAMEAAIANLVEPGDHVLVVNSGFFSSFMAEMARIHGGIVSLTPLFEDKPIPLDVFEECLSESEAKVVCVVHSETGTGLKMPIEKICPLAHSYGAVTIVDVMSSLGGVEVNVDKWKIDVAFAGCQKCLNVPPTLSVMSVSRKAWEAFENRRTPVRLWYLNFRTLQPSFTEPILLPYTFPIHSMFALNSSLKQIFREGLGNVFKRHVQESNKAKSFIRRLGLEMHNQCSLCPGCGRPDAFCTPTITAFKTPIPAQKVIKSLEKEWGVRISAGLGDHKENLLRIGHMGWQAQPVFTEAVLAALASTLKNLGLIFPPQKTSENPG